MQNPQCLLCLVGLIIQSEMYVKLVSDTKFSFYIETNLQISRFRRCTLRGAELGCNEANFTASFFYKRKTWSGYIINLMIALRRQ